MPSVKRNILANLFGRIWSSLFGLIFVPVYIHYIGIEAYGLMGVFATIQAVLSLLDSGLSTTLNREMAKTSAGISDPALARNMVFTLERIYLLVSFTTGAVLALLSWFFATRWVNAESLSEHTVVTAFMLMAVNFACQFPGSLYQGGLMGLQQQVPLNVILVVISTLKAVISIGVLYFIEPTIIAFLSVQIALSIVQLFLLRFTLYKRLPPSQSRVFFDRPALKSSGRFTLGVIFISGLTIVLTQSDKIILSKIVPLSEFGYYTLAATIASSLAMLLFPVISAVFPKMTELINKQEMTAACGLFHNSSQLVALLIFPLTFSIFIFSDELLLAWTKNPVIASQAGPILKFLIIGSGINSLITIPYQYTLAVGWVRFGINITVVAIVVFLPVIFFTAYRFGVLGSAFVWMVLNFSYLLFAMIYLFSRHLKTEMRAWYLADIGRPFVICTMGVLPFLLVKNHLQLTLMQGVLLFGFCLAVSYSVTLYFGTPEIMSRVIALAKGRKPKSLAG